MSKAQQQAPPATVPGKTAIRVQKNAQVDIAVYAEVVADGSDPSITGAKTSFDMVGAIVDPATQVASFYRTPGYQYQVKAGLKVITKLAGPVEIKGSFMIQTVYGPGASADQTSGYGRGTTKDDEDAGNTTLGFHESCHRADFFEFLRTRTLPAFAGAAGMTVPQYEAAVAKFKAAMDQYSKDMENFSNARTDEVGYKKSVYKAKGPRP